MKKQHVLIVICLTAIISSSTTYYLVAPYTVLDIDIYSELGISSNIYVVKTYFATYDIVKNRIGFKRIYLISRELISTENSSNLNLVLQNAINYGNVHIVDSGIYLFSPGIIYMNHTIVVGSSNVTLSGGYLSKLDEAPAISIEKKMFDITIKNMTVVGGSIGISASS